MTHDEAAKFIGKKVRISFTSPDWESTFSFRGKVKDVLGGLYVEPCTVLIREKAKWEGHEEQYLRAIPLDTVTEIRTLR